MGGVTLTGSNVRDRDRLPAPPLDGETALRLGRDSSEDALEKLRGYAPDEIAGALQELTPAKRMEFLELAERVDEIVPLLPEAEFTTTIVGAGIEENGWLVRHATPEQRIAAVDLDCWRDFRFSPSRLLAWIDALIEAGPETLVAAFDDLDPEIWVLALRAMGDFSAFGMGSADPDEAMTEDGAVFYDAFSAEDEQRIRTILGTALAHSPSHYFWLVQGAISQGAAETELFAAQWQQSRLNDLGFPARDQAMAASRPLHVEEAPVLDVGEGAERDAPGTPSSQVPARLSGSLAGRALLELPLERANAVMGEILAVANALAVADKLPLAEPETVERSLAKALRGIDRGLAEVARARDQGLGVVLDGTPVMDLFRIGATLDTGLRPRKSFSELLAEEQDGDWNVETEILSEEDRTLGPDGRIR